MTGDVPTENRPFALDRSTDRGAKGSAGLYLLVALPALNEEKTVGQVIQQVPREIPGISVVEVLVVDDGSEDRTVEEAERAGARVIRHAATRGVGGAFQSAVAYGLDQGADLIVSLDADGQFDAADIPALIAPVVAGQADFATASRFKDPALTPRMTWSKLWGNRFMSRLISRLTGQKFYDVSCGMRCYHRRAALQLYLLARFTYTQEVFLNLASRQVRMVEVPIRVRGERAADRRDPLSLDEHVTDEGIGGRDHATTLEQHRHRGLLSGKSAPGRMRPGASQRTSCYLPPSLRTTTDFLNFLP
jgi:hypothetical protein